MWESAATKRRLAALEELVESQQRKINALELDWEEMYEKFRTLLARISKRQQREEDRGDPPAAIDSPDPRQLSLTGTDRTEALNRQIHEQRRARAIPTNGVRQG